MVLSILGWASFIAVDSEEATQGAAVASLLMDIVGSAILAWLLAEIQRNLNSYWDSLSESPSIDARIGVGEVIFAIVGVIFWFGSVSLVLG